jgi:hypothetical protein
MAVKQTPLTAGNPSYLDVLSSGVLTDTNKIRTAVERTKLAVFEKKKQSTHCQRTLAHDGIHSRPKKTILTSSPHSYFFSPAPTPLGGLFSKNSLKLSSSHLTSSLLSPGPTRSHRCQRNRTGKKAAKHHQSGKKDEETK